MRVIISNDLKRLYGKLDHSLLEKTVLSKSYQSGSQGVTVENPAGFSANDYVIIGDPGTDKAEIVQISSISSTQFNFSSALIMDHTKKDSIYKIGYNQIKFYESDVLLDTVTITPDFLVEYAHAVDTTLYYHITFYNSTTTTETAAGEKIKGYNRLLCSIGDIYQLESSCALSSKILDKIEFATREILNKFITQDYDISDLANFDVLKQPCACLALKYYFAEQIKAKDDIASIKEKYYANLYTQKINEAGNVINKVETDVKLWGQTIIER